MIELNKVILFFIFTFCFDYKLLAIEITDGELLLSKKVIFSEYYQMDPGYCEVKGALNLIQNGRYDVGMPLLDQLSLQGNVSAKRFLAKLLSTPIGGREYRKVDILLGDIRSYYMKFAMRGDGESMFLLGDLCEYSVNLDIKECVKWLEKSSAVGNPNAQYRLSIYYRDGFGVKKNQKKQIFWLKKAANNGSLHAQRDYGLLLLKSENQVGLAIEYLTRSASSNDPISQYNLGFVLRHNYGQDEKGLDWITRSANQGYKFAIQYLKTLYLHREDKAPVFDIKENALFWKAFVNCNNDRKK